MDEAIVQDEIMLTSKWNSAAFGQIKPLCSSTHRISSAMAEKSFAFFLH